MKTRIITTLIAALLCANIYGQVQPQHQTTGTGIQVGPKLPTAPFTPINVDIQNNNDPEINPEEPRLVFWMHGLGGDKNAWSDAALASEVNVEPSFPARKIRSITDTEYDEDLGALDAAFYADQQLAKFLPLGGNPDQNFVIAHSQGGIVTRGMAYLEHCHVGASPPNFGGFVTFGTPNQGAMILNNSEMFDQLIGDLCNEMTAGPIKEELDQLSRGEFKVAGIELKYDLKLDERLGDMPMETFCGIIEETFVPLIRSNHVTPITEDYRVGAEFIREMDQCESEDFRDMSKMAFYGIEPVEGLLPRTMQWLMVNPNTEDYFDANDDGAMIELWNDNYFRYMDRVAHWQDRYDRAKSEYDNNKCYTALRYYWQKCNRFRRRKSENLSMVQAWQRGVDFLNAMDDRYKLIIGSLELNPVTLRECWTRKFAPQQRGGGHHIEYGPWTFSHTISPSNPRCQPSSPKDEDLYQTRVINLIERTEFDSDGVVLAESASNLADATFPPQLCDNSSHMQIRNDRNTREKLFNLYQGNYDKFFKTEPL